MSTDVEIDAAFDAIAQQRLGAIVVAAGPFFDTRRDRLVTSAARYKIPAMYHFREFTEAGGLISYGVDARVIYRQIGVYAVGFSMEKSQAICRCASLSSSSWS